MQNLCIDIGNTKVKWAYYEDSKLVSHQVAEHDKMLWDQLVKPEYHLDGIAISNVSDLTDYEFLSHHTDLYVLMDSMTPLPFQNAYETPETLGRDRIAGILGAQAMFPDEACCVIDIGTCVTYDFIDNQKVYQGGNISPGVNLRLQAMHHFTDGLPLLQIEESDAFLGKSTKTAMLNGAMNGLLYEIEGFLRRLEEATVPTFKTILTGGGSEHFGRKLKKEIFVNPFLIPYGLNALLHQF